MAGRRSRTIVEHRPVRFLQIPRSWKVGGVVFRPRGWVAQRARAAPGTNPAFTRERAISTAEQAESATVELRVAIKPEGRRDQGSEADAIQRARDAIALLRFYQRRSLRAVDLDAQQFGLVPDISSEVEDYWQEVGDGTVLPAWQRHGNLADFEFSAKHVHAFWRDPRFRWLESLLGAHRGLADMETRVLEAIRILGRQSRSTEVALRLVLFATVIEVLFGERVQSSDPSTFSRDRQHRVARRASYLGCLYPERPHGPTRGSCFYLETMSTKALFSMMSDYQKRGRGNLCTYYWELRRLMDLRNAVVHDGRWDLREHRVGQYAYLVEGLLEATIEWARSRSRPSLDMLDGEIAAFTRQPAAGARGRHEPSRHVRPGQSLP